MMALSGVRISWLIVARNWLFTRFASSASAVAAFGQYLRGNAALNGFTLVDILNLTNGAKGEDASGYRAEFIGLIKLAQALQGA